jgi:hypothetical protein
MGPTAAYFTIAEFPLRLPNPWRPDFPRTALPNHSTLTVQRTWVNWEKLR